MTESQAISNLQGIASTLTDPDRSSLNGALVPFIENMSIGYKEDALDIMNIIYWDHPSTLFADSLECLGDTVNPDIKYPKGLG